MGPRRSIGGAGCIDAEAVSALRPGQRHFVWDDGLPGFGVRITEGAVSYALDFRLGSRRRRVVLGAITQITLAEARDRAKEIIIGARHGDDLTINPRRGMPTFGAVWRQMIDEIDR